ncbi:hypothetical protein TR75_02015 [Hydrogenibacillus schlegelii]|uniref:Flagellar Assembly Protein A N-terminal region domain-containing protein n=1 Tax=Hydrogenibacillus schlegelii TaxID=1484 RepID=A0A132NCG1_HYDSH|nr:hypothetical protein TR75_02015 [Hydrogenibacillus schlegelii]OAR05143.1 hypothetical protein SA87_08310 [Hydrogenibacillus schlegelii]
MRRAETDADAESGGSAMDGETILWHIRPLEVRAERKAPPGPEGDDPAALLSLLAARGVRTGIDPGAVEALARGGPGVYIVARGTPPEEGQDGRVEWLVETTPVDALQDAGEDEAIDYRERRRLPSVQAGTVLARVHPPVPGRPGTSVFGEPIPPKPVYPVEVIAGAGVRYDAETGEIVAERSGLLTVQASRRKVRLAIGPLFVHRGPVDLKSGNIRFAGSVEIFGDVTEGMLVEAREQVVVHGQITRATVRSGGLIVVAGGAVGSRIVSGDERWTPGDIRALHALDESLLRLIQKIRAAQSVPEIAARLGRPEAFRSLVTAIVGEDADRIREALKRLRPLWTEGGEANGGKTHFFDLWAFFIGGVQHRQAPGPEALAAAVRWVHAAAEARPMAMLEESGVRAGYVQASRVIAFGDVVIGDRGAFQSEIETFGRAVVAGPLRGGRLYAEGGARLREAGSESGVPTQVAVGRAAAVELETVHPEVEVAVGAASLRFRERRSHVRVRLGDDGRIALEALSSL